MAYHISLQDKFMRYLLSVLYDTLYYFAVESHSIVQLVNHYPLVLKM